jgi:chromosome segregation ATPase
VYEETTIPVPLTPTQRALFEAQKHRLDTTADRLTAIEDTLSRIEAIFRHKEGHPRTVNENIAALAHRINMKEGELIGLWRELDKLEGGIAAIHNLLARRRGHAASDNRTSDMNGTSPFEDMQ